MENKVNETFVFAAKRTLVEKLMNNIVIVQDLDCQNNEMQVRFFFEGKQFSSISTDNINVVDGFVSTLDFVTETYNHLYEMIKESFLKESSKDKEQ